jgi:hypothetical protein
MSYVLHKSCKETQNSLFMFNNFFSENCAVNEIIGKNVVEQERPLMTVQCMCIACWTHSEYGILLLFHSNNVYANAPQCYIYMYSTLPVLLYMHKFNFVNWGSYLCYLHSKFLFLKFSVKIEYLNPWSYHFTTLHCMNSYYFQH